MIEGILLVAPVVDIDGTIFVQAAIFIGLMIVLKPLLFDPWLRTQDRRVEAIEGSIAKAKELRVVADGLAKDHDTRLAEARERASDLRAQERHDEGALQEKKLAEVRTAAGAELDRERGRLTAQAEAARTALRSRVDELAKDVATKLLGEAGGMIVPDPHGGGGIDHSGAIEWITPIINNGPGKMGLVWMLVNFVVLVWILERLLFKPLRNRTAAKHDAIKAELGKAQSARTEAETLVAEYRARLGRLDAEIAELTKDAKARAEADRKRIVAAAQEEAARIEASAKAAAEREGESRRRQIEAEVVDRAIARAEEILRRGIGADDHRRMTDEYVDKLGSVKLGDAARAGGGTPA